MKKIIILVCTSLLCTLVLAGNPKKKVKNYIIPAQSTMVLNQTTNSTVYSHNADTLCSMASITKLMTAMIVLDTHPNLQDKIQLKTSYLGRNEFMLEELLDLLLVRSDNYVAEILSKNFLDNRSNFIAAMNYKARVIGMQGANFEDPSGLNSNNKATAQDIAIMVLTAGNYSVIRKISSQKQINVKVQTKNGIKTINKPNTNHIILNEFSNIVLSKTGTLDAAGKCLTLIAIDHNNTYVIVILGKPNRIQRDQEARKILHDLSKKT